MIKHTLVYTDNIDESVELELHTIDNFDKLEKFIGEVNVDFRTTYSKEGSDFKVHSHGLFDSVQYDATAISDDMYRSVDLMIAKLESQLRTSKGKRTHIDRDVIISESNEDVEWKTS